ncbi:MAG TPA: histidinol dehydrogenase, partial [Bacillota bacterium]|nr:histidinol dehydrogenase [Bacillota bacterium]
MLRVLSWDEKSSIEVFLRQKDNGFIPEEVTETVKKIVRDVRDRGDSAVLEYSRKFDNIYDIKGFRVSSQALEKLAGEAE